MDKKELIKEAARRQLVKKEAQGQMSKEAANPLKFIKNLGNKTRFVNDASKHMDKADDAAKAGMNMPKMVGVMVAAIGVAQFVKHMIEYAKRKNLERKKPKYYEKMIKANPDLMNEDPQEVMDLWNTLFHNSPHMASDPIAAGAFITQNIQGRTRSELGGPTVDAYSTLNSIESDAQGSRDRRLGSDTDVTDALLAGLGLA